MTESKKTNYSLGILFIIASAACFALMNLFIRLAGDVPTMQKCFFRNFFAILLSIFILKEIPTVIEWISVVIVMIGAMFVVKPTFYDFSIVIFTAILGFLFLDQVPDYLSVIGYVIIIGTALVKWYLSTQKPGRAKKLQRQESDQQV